MAQWLAVLQLLSILIPIIIEFLQSIEDAKKREQAANAFSNAIGAIFNTRPSVEEAQKSIAKVFGDILTGKLA